MRKLWKTQSRHRESRSLSLLVSHPTIPIFWGLSPHPMENPKPVPRSTLDNRGRSATRGGVMRAFSVA